jgi:hypothetical protein
MPLAEEPFYPAGPRGVTGEFCQFMGISDFVESLTVWGVIRFWGSLTVRGGAARSQQEVMVLLGSNYLEAIDSFAEGPQGVTGKVF